MNTSICVPGDLVVFFGVSSPNSVLYTHRDLKDVTSAGEVSTRRPLLVLAVVSSSHSMSVCSRYDVLLAQYVDGVTIIGWEYDGNVVPVQPVDDER